MTPWARILEVRTGRVARLGSRRTAYAKTPRMEPVALGPLGLAGDEVGDRRVHGGPDKAVHLYFADHYPRWAAEHPRHAGRLVPGAFGENLVLAGLDERSVCVGDRWRAGSALLEPCQPRQPCATLMVRAMVANGRSGVYARVLEPGRVAAGDPFVLEHRPPGAWSVARVLEVSYWPPSAVALRALAAAPGLAAGWAEWARQAASAPRPKPL
ncbi:MAG: MOSC domain-containing protein [Sphingomonadaceae bacterium]|uniref:MOSC domain-containing protein n=1 Tax=Thermaurantiacus sp. TaxID=2820283 RepID=UPI00298F185F|nr:MOSC domain-containing protein [Thermaurantiacus sp.]MCS6987622.1 MOSC domain-containing protein [Sphingomonadaceae bacterium]MDW8415223.1 MOSC domain-containing protein [Thermaurantiacus sp.]